MSEEKLSEEEQIKEQIKKIKGSSVTTSQQEERGNEDIS